MMDFLSAIGDLIVGLFNLIKGFVVFIGEAIGTIAGHLWALVTETEIYLTRILPEGLLWLWDNWLIPVFEYVYSLCQEIPLQAFIDATPLGATIYNNYVQHFIDIHLIVGLFIACVNALIWVTIFKFTLKRIPIIGG